MSWWGKLLGGAFGFMLGGPLGAALGAALGHGFDTGLERADQVAGIGVSQRERTQTAFFTATFSVMGHLAKSDGRVTHDELRVATAIMDEMRLDSVQRHLAQNLFRQGKASDFPLDDMVDQLRAECRASRGLLRMFLQIQLEAAYVDGVVHEAERRVLDRVRRRLGMPAAEMDAIEMLVAARHGHFQHHAGGTRPPHAPANHLDEAYRVLGVTPDNSDEEVKRAYRRLMSQHHPDKLVAKGLPEEMVRVANEKAKDITVAYERVREARGM